MRIKKLAAIAAATTAMAGGAVAIAAPPASAQTGLGYCTLTMAPNTYPGVAILASWDVYLCLARVTPRPRIRLNFTTTEPAPYGGTASCNWKVSTSGLAEGWCTIASEPAFRLGPSALSTS